MLSPQVIASLLLVAGASMVAGWVVAFRDRYYLVLLGLAFCALSGALLAGQRVQVAVELGASEPGFALLARVLFVASSMFGVAAVVAAVMETRRRLAMLRESYRAAEEALIAMAQAAKQREESRGEEDGAAPAPRQDDGQGKQSGGDDGR